MTTTPTNKHPLSDTLEDVITNETYGLFPVPISKYTLPNHDVLKQQIMLWVFLLVMLCEKKADIRYSL